MATTFAPEARPGTGAVAGPVGAPFGGWVGGAVPAVVQPGARRPSLLPTVLAAGFLVGVLTSAFGAVAALVSVLALGLGLLRLAWFGRLDRVGWAALAYLAFQAAMGWAVGSLPRAGQIGGFLSFDGRAYVAYVPLIVYATVRTTPGDVRRLRALLRLSVLFGLVLLAASILGAVPGLSYRGNFYGLTSSHHVPGLTYGVVAIVLGAAASAGHRLRDRALALGALAIVMASGSRTAIAGLLVAAAYLVVSAPSLRRRVRNVLVSLLALGVALLVSGRLLTTAQYLASDDFVGAAATEFSQADTVETGKQLQTRSTDQAALANVLIRFGVWRAGLDEFARSPVVGIGAFRLNDADRGYVGIPGVVEVATSGDNSQSAGFGAHNLVIQTLAETGVVGLALLAWPWLLLRRRFRSGVIPRPEARTGLALLAFAAGTMITSNSLISPALVFPLGVCCMTYARLRHPAAPPVAAPAP